MYRIFFFIALLLVALSGFYRAQASHTVGGEVTYTAMGNNTYQISFRLFRDCANGSPDAIAQDNPLHYAVFDAGTGTRLFTDSIYQPQIAVLPGDNSHAGCGTVSDQSLCVNYATFKKTLQLSPNTGGYIVAYERCCLAYFNNIFQADVQGITLYTTIPPVAVGPNSSPVFDALPVRSVCVNELFKIDNSATDPDGDALTYHISPTLRGSTSSNVSSVPTVIPAGAELSYTTPYSGSFPLNGAGQISIDSNTGIIRGHCYNKGTYLITVSCDEHRNGAIINTTRRIFRLMAVDCQKETSAGIVASPPVLQYDSIFINQCAGLRSVQFKNSSSGATNYAWDFGDPSSATNDTSSLVEPLHTYPAAGLYPVTLIAYGANCNDTLKGYVQLSDDTVQVDFNILAPHACILDTISLQDASVSSSAGISNYAWISGGVTAYGNPSSLIFTTAGTYTIKHLVTTAGGCTGTASKDITITSAHIYAGGDTTITGGTPFNLNPSGGVSYMWFTGSSQITLPTVFQAYAGSSSTLFYVIGTDAQGCRGVDSLNINFATQGYVYVPSAFSPNGDGRNEELSVHQSGYSFVEFRVYNRQGREVFYSTDQHHGWDGMVKGKPAPSEVFYWMARMKDAGGGITVFKGDAMLVR